MLAILFLWTMVLGRTRFGRYVYAIGGNAEAARRAGINLVRIRTIAFALCGLTAGLTGIIWASLPRLDLQQHPRRSERAQRRRGGGHRRCQPVRRRGRMLHAVLGGLVVGVINNGLQLLGLTASAQLMWTALVLLAAVVVDRLTRRGQTTT